MARAASAVEDGLAAAHMETNAFGALKVAVVDERRHGGAGNVRHALKRAARNADQQGMRRALALGLVAALAAAATALAATPRDGTFRAQKNKIQEGSELSFRVSGSGAKVSNLRARLLETCQGKGSSALTTIASSATWSVRAGKFAARKKEVRAGTTYYTTFEGEFTSSSRVAGSIRQVALRAGRRCDTYKVPFTARRA